jgi:hypothetical protein
MPRQRAAGHFSADTVDFIGLLQKYGVRYLIVGGEAVIYCGYVRLTGDVGFFYDTAPENTEFLFRALTEFWGGEIPGVETPTDLSRPDQVLQFGRPPNRIDLLTKISGISFGEAWGGRERVELLLEGGDRVSMQYIGLPQLMVNKTASGRPKDLDDLNFLNAS